MGKLVASARQALQARESASRDLRERDALADSAKQLRSWESELCKRFPVQLTAAFGNPDVLKRAQSIENAGLQFDQLELMDEDQVLGSVTLAKIQQTVTLVVDASLADVNTLICGVLGLTAVRPERNPLRPEIYLHALKEAVGATQLPSKVQMDWLNCMGTPLGQELRALYAGISAKLRERGVKAAGYSVTYNPASVGRMRVLHEENVHQGHSVDQPVPVAPVSAASSVRLGRQDDALLTLDRLRRLLLGELDGVTPPTDRKAAFAQQFSREFENANGAAQEAQTDFDATVPAALEALTEMKQVDRVVQRLAQRGTPNEVAAPGDTSVAAIRSTLRRKAASVAQVLSLEVVALMVDNIARDTRLLEPVRQWVRRLEPSLLRLALGDPRFFTDKQHSARLFVQEIAHRSLGFGTVDASGFNHFLNEIEAAIIPIEHATEPQAEVFFQALTSLRAKWSSLDTQQKLQRDLAVRALQSAEARNVLAEKIAREIDAHPDSRLVPEVVIEFLCGPWAQVVAQARIAGGTGCSLADKYQALISAMLWSVHPELAPKNISKLTRLVPVLLNTLREGLETIHYPPTKASIFLESLMGLHQLAFRAASKSVGTATQTPTPVAAPLASTSRAQWLDEGDPWIAPGEAQQSNLMELSDVADAADLAVSDPATALAQAKDVLQALARAAETTVENLPLGSWVELFMQGQWSRTQLTWASPHGTLFLFTSVYGTTQSMTRRVRDKLIQAGSLRVLSGQPVVDGALDAVAQVAMQNSIDTQG